MSLSRGTISGLIGQTGSGKSTLLQHLNGLIRPQTGQVIVDGLDWADPNLDARAARRVIGLLFQQAEDQLFERFVGDDVAFGPRQLKLDHAEIRQRVRSAMDAVGLPFEAFKDRLTQTLSGGEQRRAALAGVLALQPRVLVADEPTAGLDPRGRADILNIFRRINQQGVSLLVASHRMEDIAALCESVVALRGGQVAAAGPTRAVLSQPDMLERHGLPPLPLIAVVNALRSAGWPVPSDALSVPEIAAALAEPYHNQPS
jgi:energy-coupling factor transport system ATP-binding protein